MTQTPPHPPDQAEPHAQEEAQSEQSLISHLLELRTRLLRSLFVALMLFGPIYYFANDLYLLIAEPLLTLLPEASGMIATEVASPFLTPLKLSLILAIFAAAPYALLQVWMFVAPGLYRREKRFVMPMLMCSVLLFYGGMVFVYFAVMPLVFQFTTSVAPEGVTVMTDISRYLDFVMKLFFAFGLAFQIPVLVLLLIRTRIASLESLKRKRPYVLVGCFAVGMLLTPPDVISQALLAVPMWLLYELALVLGYWVAPKAEPGEDEGEGDRVS